MRKYKIILLLFIALFCWGSSFSQKKVAEDNKWSGTISYTQSNKNIGSDRQGEIKTEWNYFYQSSAYADITNNQVLASRSETTNDFVKTTSPFGKGLDQVEVRTKKISCERRDSIAAREISVEINNKDSIYSISLSAPACIGYMHSTYENNIFQMAGQPATNDTKDIEYDVLNINIFNQKLGKDHNALNGHTVEKIARPGGDTVITTISWNLRKACPPWKNPLTETNINTLDARVRGPATRFIKRVHDELCIKLKVVSGFRTIAEQRDKYASGRTLPGLILTHAPAGTSYHNFALAIDVHMVNDDGTIDLVGIVPQEVVEIARQEGFEWGGYWPGKKRDPPHFQMTFGQTIEQLRIQHGIH